MSRAPAAGSGDEASPLAVWQSEPVWFRDLIPAHVPWGDEALLDPVPAEAAGSFGLKAAADQEIDGQRYRGGEFILVDSFADLLRLLERFPAVSDLIVPWYGRLIPAAWIEPHRQTVDLASYRAEFGGRFVRSLLLTTGLVAAGFMFPDFRVLALLFATLYGLSPLVESGLAWLRRVDRFSVLELNRRLVNFELFRRWILRKRSRLLQAGLACLIAVFAGQMWVGIDPSIEAAALLKGAVLADGEWWRTVTTGLMHGSLLHIVFNGMALYSLGRVIVALVSPPLLSFVFLFTVVTGSLASLYLGPAPASVGASGGILGCLGFLLVITFKFRGVLPGFLQTNLIQSTLVVAIFGALGASFIDNAAHAGGLAGGVLLGLISWPWIRLAPTTVKPGVRILSVASIGVLGAGLGKIAMDLWKLAPIGAP
jgi:membrane associated rhomboid family serine protease